MDVTVLGPQRRTAAAATAVAELIPTGPVATINAGWQEREDGDAELNEVLGGRMVNLRLHHRWQQLMADDPDYAAAERRLTELLAERQEIYALRLVHAMAAAQAVARRDKEVAAHDAAVADSLRAIADLDRWHLSQVAETRAEFYAETRIGERDSVAAHRAELRRLVRDCAGTVVAGGHVGVLLHVLHIFGLAGMVGAPLICWSAGAMALSDRVVLFHHHGPPGRRYPEVFAEGLGAYSGVLPFPHPRRRLPLHDLGVMSVTARRFAPRVCLLLPDGDRVDLADHRPLPRGARWVSSDGQVVTGEGQSGG